jgi:hypothetical protein
MSTFPRQASNPRSQWFIPNPYLPFVKCFLSSKRTVQNLDNLVYTDAQATEVIIVSRWQQKRNSNRTVPSTWEGKWSQINFWHNFRWSSYSFKWHSLLVLYSSHISYTPYLSSHRRFIFQNPDTELCKEATSSCTCENVFGYSCSKPGFLPKL